MHWVFLCAIAGSTVAIAYIVWRNWIGPWREIERLVRQIGRGERPATFLVDGGPDAERVGVALEDIFSRQQELDRQLGQRTSGEKAIFSAMQDGLLVVNAERRIALLNRTFQELFEIRDDSPGTPLLETVRDASVDEIVRETFRKRDAVRREITVANRHFQMDSVPMGDNSCPITGAVVLLHDITELRRADQIRRDFVANLSHELRTPLSILRGYIETLLDAPQTSRDELRRILGVMERHSNRLGLLLSDLLNLAKLESTHPNLELSSVRLDELCLNLARDWEKKLSEKNLDVIVDLASGSPRVVADAFRLQEVLYNLLDNAVKYSPNGGEIRLRVQRREGEIALSVSDQGMGISKEDLPRIFERFYRADKTRSREERGTGLGLAIVKHIAELHGGRVEAESELGKGTTIRVFIPAVTQT
jgi:two-component system phosphate regulon sensor histidine kinase PhoR